MSFEEFVNSDNRLFWSYKGWRCLYCGDIIDPLILQHRMRMNTLIGEDVMSSHHQAASHASISRGTVVAPSKSSEGQVSLSVSGLHPAEARNNDSRASKPDEEVNESQRHAKNAGLSVF